MASDQIQTAESVAIERFVTPTEEQIRLVGGDNGAIVIRSDVAYGRAGTALQTVRQKRKALAAYFKEQPNGDPGPGQGLCYFARRAWESAQSLFNRFDLQFKQWDEAIDGGMKKYRQEVEEKARIEAEAKAAEERNRLEAEAAKQRAEAEKERKRLEAEAEAQRKIAEAERKKRLAAEMAAAKSHAAEAAAKRRAEEERQRIEHEALCKRMEADAEARRQREEADAKEREAANVVAVVEREVPQAAGVSVRKVWKAEVLDIGKLVKAIADGKAPLILVEANESQCNKLAAAFGGQNPPAGLRFYQDEQTSARKVK